MPSYPTAYRRGRSPQRARAIRPPEMPGLGGLPYVAGIYAAGWAFMQLADNLQGWSIDAPLIPSTQLPSAYGWTLTLDCLGPGIRKIPAVLVCGNATIAKASWEAPPQNPLNPTVFDQYEFLAPGRYNAALLRYEQVPRTRHWERLGPGAVPYSNLTIAPAIPRPASRPRALNALYTWLGMRERGYSARVSSDMYYPAIPPQTGDDVIIRYPPIVIGPSTPPRVFTRANAQVLSVPRAVAAPGVHEIKLAPHTAAGRAFIAMYQGLNLLGDLFGFTRALWRAIPKSHRGRSRRWDNQAKDIWRYAGYLMREGSDEETRNYLMMAAYRTGIWKIQDAVMGTVQSQIFNAQVQRYGEAAAHTWSTLDSAINMTENRLRRAASRTQEPARL